METDPVIARVKPMYRSNMAREEHAVAIKKNVNRLSLMNRDRKITNNTARNTNKGSDHAIIDIRTNVIDASSVAVAATTI